MSQLSVNFTGRVAFITGGGSGIGRGFALQMARCGAAVAVADLNGDAGKAVAGEIDALGGRSLSVALNVADAAATAAAVGRTIGQLGHLDFLFANAGVLGPSDYLDIAPAEWDLVLDVNVKRLAHSCRAAPAQPTATGNRAAGGICAAWSEGDLDKCRRAGTA
jgi:meso-butanediol dehydrogenase / (S,S)-butanediol dehydrogenase / diacetyl reductase